jgi:hypothetical protein
MSEINHLKRQTTQIRSIVFQGFFARLSNRLRGLSRGIAHEHTARRLL